MNPESLKSKIEAEILLVETFLLKPEEQDSLTNLIKGYSCRSRLDTLRWVLDELEKDSA